MYSLDLMSPLATYVIETLITLVAIALLAALVVYAARRMGVGRPTGPLELVGRLPLDARRAVYLVRVGKKVLVLGASESKLSKLGELEGDAIDWQSEPTAPLAFRDVLGRALRKRKSNGDDGAT